ncbi:MAG: FecR domain-containing protein [Sphingobacteriales bacterium]|nr:FecR domain-containing protein [Sphingobacteriales bacterium]
MSSSKAQLLASLAEKFLAGEATQAEEEQLHQLYDSWNDDEEEVVTDTEQPEVLRAEIFQALKERINAERAASPKRSPGQERSVGSGHSYRKMFWRSVAAAAVIAVGLLIYNQTVVKKGAASLEQKALAINNQPVVPGKDKATLTLADGSVVDLDSSDASRMAQQGDTRIRIKDGKIVYDPSKAGSAATVYNTITTSRGGQYQVVLPDGTRVWLNATSSIKFPVAFAGNSRVVEVSGEAYFEVAKNPAMPFIAKVKDVEVEVLGTHFDVMAYGEEGKIATTLLEGSVRVSKGREKYAIAPGQQVVWSEDGAFSLNTDVDLEEVIAWKNGKFHFNNVDIKTIMRQIARWYDVDVAYENVAEDIRLGGVVSRKEDIRQLLDYFEVAGKVRFRVEGRKVIVSK